MKISTFFAVFFLLVSVGDVYGETAETAGLESFHLSYKKHRIDVKAMGTIKKISSDCSVKNIFDNNKNTKWCVTTEIRENGHSLVINFYDEVYIEKMSLLNGQCGEKYGAVKVLSVDRVIMYQNPWEFEKGYRMKDITTAQSIDFLKEKGGASTYDLFPVKSLVIDVMAVYPNNDGNACIADIDIDIKRKASFKPKHTWKEVKDYIFSHSNASATREKGGLWVFDVEREEKKRDLNVDYFTELSYFVIKGNKDAIQLFFMSDPYNEGQVGIVPDVFKPLMKEFLKTHNIRY